MRLAGPLLLLGLGLLVGCNHAPALPGDLKVAEEAERAPSPEAALADYDAIVAGCRKQGRPEPKDPCGTAALRRGQLLEKAERPADAVAAYLEVRALSGDGRTIARALLRAATLYAGPLRQPAEALRLSREVVLHWPDEVPAEDALRLLIEVETDTNDPGLPAELGRLADALSTHEVVGSFALLYQARYLEAHGQPAPALVAYDTIWSRFPHGPLFDDALVAAAKLLRGQHRSAEAAERLERLESSFTGSIIVGHYNKLLLDEGAILLGEIYLQDLRQPERAIRALDGLLRRQRTSLLCDDALLLMAQAALARHTPRTEDDQREACRYLARLLREYPDGNRVRRATALKSELACRE